MNPLPLVWAMHRRNRFTSALFLVIVALAVALGITISAQERALRQGSARAADRFDLVVAAPGSANDILFSVVYLRPTAVELLDPAVFADLLARPEADFVAPIGFGDNIEGDPVVGTIAPFVDYLSGGLAEGRMFAAHEEAVIGALSPHAVGETLAVGHGEMDADAAADAIAAEEHADEHDEHGHVHGAEGHADLTVVGRMRPTGTPWDRAVIVPIEYNWEVHGLDLGHAPGDERIGPPFAPEHLPGVPAVVVKPHDVAAAYGLRGQYRSERSTAFFPAEILVGLYDVLGDATRIMSALTLVAQVLVVAAILAGIVAILDLMRRRFAVLRALGAGPLFVFLTVWLYVAVLIIAGAALGLGLGWALAAALSAGIAADTGVAMQASIGGSELLSLLAFCLAALILATIPALLIYRRPVIEGLR
ncbi:FtsX-like permease family protein [uncultured Devosia sp.]|uniref:FtsX-like permease family protein n=1 Tax=uncultured Devosia sp. TaxID=211434 RepID=UPI0035CAE0B0